MRKILILLSFVLFSNSSFCQTYASICNGSQYCRNNGYEICELIKSKKYDDINPFISKYSNTNKIKIKKLGDFLNNILGNRRYYEYYNFLECPNDDAIDKLTPSNNWFKRIYIINLDEKEKKIYELKLSFNRSGYLLDVEINNNQMKLNKEYDCLINCEEFPPVVIVEKNETIFGKWGDEKP